MCFPKELFTWINVNKYSPVLVFMWKFLFCLCHTLMILSVGHFCPRVKKQARVWLVNIAFWRWNDALKKFCKIQISKSWKLSRVFITQSKCWLFFIKYNSNHFVHPWYKWVYFIQPSDITVLSAGLLETLAWHTGKSTIMYKSSVWIRMA